MKHRIKPGDFFLVAGLFLALVIAGTYWVLNSANASDSSVNGLVVVTQTREGFRRVDPLDEPATFTVETSGTGSAQDAQPGFNIVRICEGTVLVERADCGNQVCVQHAPIKGAGEQIVCLPHGLVVEIARSESEASRLH